MNDALPYISQLAAGKVLWNEHSQDSGIWRDLQSLAPFSVPMKVDLSPWLDWIKQNGVEFSSSWVIANKTIGEVLATCMSSWADDWRQKMGYSKEQAAIFMEEWKYVLTAPCLAPYRQSTTGIAQLGKLAFEVYVGDRPHQAEMRASWAYDTLGLLPDLSVCKVAFTVWSETTPETRQRLNPTWAQWYDLFSEFDSFLQCVRGESTMCEETLPLPNGMLSEAPSPT